MSQLLPYETIVKAIEGDPEAVAAISNPSMKKAATIIGNSFSDFILFYQFIKLEFLDEYNMRKINLTPS